MPVSLQKGGDISLSKAVADLAAVIIGLGWDPRSTDGAAFDLDASAFLLADAGKVRSDADLVFYGQRESAETSVVHQGDIGAGAGDGDAERIKVDLSRVPADITRVVFAVTGDDAENSRRNFGQVGKAFIRVVNAADNAEITRYDLSEDASTNTAMIFGELYRNGPEWKFRAVGQGHEGGLAAMCRRYGVAVA